MLHDIHDFAVLASGVCHINDVVRTAIFQLLLLLPSLVLFIQPGVQLLKSKHVGEPVFSCMLGCFKTTKIFNCCLMSHFLAFKKEKCNPYSAKVRLEGFDSEKHCK